MQPDLVGNTPRMRLHRFATTGAAGPRRRVSAHTRLLAHHRVEQSRRDPALPGHHRLEQTGPTPGWASARTSALGIRMSKMSRVAWLISSILAAHRVPVLAEILPRVRDGPHAHPVHPVTLHVLVEQLTFLCLGEATAQKYSATLRMSMKKVACASRRSRDPVRGSAGRGVHALDGGVESP